MIAVERFRAAVVAGRDRKVNRSARRQGVGQVSTRNSVAAAQRDDRLVVQRIGEMDERAVGGERPVAECLGKIVGGIVVVDPENALVFPAEKVLRVGQLHAESRRTLNQP